MAVVSYVGKRRLPPSVKQIFQMADVGLCKILIPAIVIVEVSYLSERNRIDLLPTELKLYIDQFPSYTVQDLTVAIIETAFQITDIPELHDRLIAGTSCFL